MREQQALRCQQSAKPVFKFLFLHLGRHRPRSTVFDEVLHCAPLYEGNAPWVPAEWPISCLAHDATFNWQHPQVREVLRNFHFDFPTGLSATPR